MGRPIRLATGFVLALMAAAPLPAMAADPGGEWRHTAFVYGMGAAIEGDAQIGNLSVAVDVSMSELFDALEFGAMAAYRVENDTWSVMVDATYMGLGGGGSGPGGRVNASADIDQTTLMATVGRRWTEHTEVLFSLGYFNLSTVLKVSSSLPGGLLDRRAARDADWIDPMIGLQYNRPLNERWRLNLRGDVGGFGVGSDILFHALANVGREFNENLGMVIGYRLISFDYEEGSGANYQHYDLDQHGPLIGLRIRF